MPRFSAAPICDVCWSEFPALSGPACTRCGDALEATAKFPLCRACRLAPPAFERAVAYGIYDGRMRGAIHALKFDGVHPAGARLGSMLAQAIAQLAGDAGQELLVVPIPLHRKKLAHRGFNQARLLAAEALRALRKMNPSWHLQLAPSTLMRLRQTASQAGLGPHERRANVRGAFAVSDDSLVAGRGVLLVDDIMTTGATVRSAAQTLIKAGAAQVWVATLARARRSTRMEKELSGLEDRPGSDPAVQARNLFGTIASSHGQSSF